jgi:hypothetical protein
LTSRKAPAKKGASKSKKTTAKAKAAPGKKASGSTKAKPQSKLKSGNSAGVMKAKKLEAQDAAEPKQAARASARTLTSAASTSHPQRNSDFPSTYIKQIDVSLMDPDHLVTLTWTGPEAASQEKGPFRSSPGAGLKGLNCNDTTTSRRSGTLCTPKGTFPVQGFASRLNSDARAIFVTWFVRARGIALHYFPSVPRFAASHGCVRIEQKRIAQLIHSNSRIDLTKVVVDGTWTKPAKQY